MKHNKKMMLLVAAFSICIVLVAGIVPVIMGDSIASGQENQEAGELTRRGEIVQFSGDVHVAENELIEGDVVAFSGDVTIDGTVEGDVVAFAGGIDINGSVDGDVVSMGGNVSVASDASLGGSVVSLEAAGITEKLSALGIGAHYVPGLMIMGGIFGFALRIFSLLAFLVIGVLVAHLLEDYVNNMSNHLESNIGRVALLGFVGLVLLPVLILALTVTIIGIPIVPFVFLGFFVLVFYGYVALAVLIGRYILNLFKVSQIAAVELIVGYVAIWIVRQLPLLSSVIFAVIVIISLGLVIDSKFGTLRPWFKK